MQSLTQKFLYFVIVLMLANLSCYGRRSNALEAALIEEGEYHGRLIAKSGSQKGEVAEGEIIFVQAERGDRSPTSGEQVSDLRSVKFWGSTNISLEKVAAPLCNPLVKPDSHDPVFPGLIVIQTEDNPALILISTAANRRDGRLTSDGCGIRLDIHRATKDGCLEGRWKEWGVIRDGRGVFSMCPLNTQVNDNRNAAARKT